MKRKERKTYLKKQIFLIFFSFLFFQLISATAQFQTIPFQQMGTGSYNEINLRDYCSSDTSYCRDSSFGIQFRNPDNGQQVQLLTSGESDNSYFTITLINGLVQIQAKGKTISTSITVYGADVEYSSQASTQFTLSIVDNSNPTQIASFYTPTIYGNNSLTYNLNNFFLNFNEIIVNYNDNYLNATVNLDELTTTTATSCGDGQIKVCLASSTGSMTLTITGKNISYNSSQSGGNYITITAKNPYGQITDAFPLTVQPQTFQVYNVIPIRNPISIAPLLMNQYENRSVNFSVFYRNFTSVTWLFNLNNSAAETYNVTINTNGTMTLCNIANSSCYDQSGLWTDVDSTDPTDNYAYRIHLRFFRDFSLYASSINQSFSNFLINVSACNNIGCISTDAFGNPDILYVSVNTSLPSVTPATFSPLELGYRETKLFYWGNMFSGFTSLILNWSEGTQNFTLSMPTSGYNSSTFNQTGGALNIKYQMILYPDSFMSITSATTTHNFTIYPLACNSAGCVTGTLGINQSLLVNIYNQSTGVFQNSSTGVTSDLFRNIFNVVFGLFPDSNTLDKVGRANFVLITIALIAGLILFFGYRSGGTILPLMIFAGLLSAFMLVFFVTKGYLGTEFIVVPLVLGILMFIGRLFLK